jgi:hypothetical protein
MEDSKGKQLSRDEKGYSVERGCREGRHGGAIQGNLEGLAERLKKNILSRKESLRDSGQESEVVFQKIIFEENLH